jgi:hypothetical protein
MLLVAPPCPAVKHTSQSQSMLATTLGDERTTATLASKSMSLDRKQSAASPGGCM